MAEEPIVRFTTKGGARARVRPLPRAAAARYPRIVRAEGVYLYDDGGKRYLDASSGAVVANVGHGRAEIADVAARQLREVAFVHSSQFVTRPVESLAERLGDWLPEGAWRFFPTSGGSEATESALKFVRQYHVERGRPKKRRIVSRATGYHGATLGALAASGYGSRRALFETFVPDDVFLKLPKPDPHGSAETEAQALERLVEQAGPETIAAVLLEPILGAADPALAPPDGTYRRVQEICERHDILFVADEVMCGLGRAGAPLGLDHWGVVPDVVVLGKGLAAGYAPLGGIAVREDVYEPVATGSGAFRHGFTYSGHPVAAAVGERVLRILSEEDLVRRSAEQGATLVSGLRRLKEDAPVIHEVRGLGLLVGVVLGSPATGEPFATPGFAYAVGDAARVAGLNLYPGTGAVDGTRGDHLLIGPPLTVSDVEIDELLGLLDTAIRAVEPFVPHFEV
jgi:adenosylmethionine-8-amino-7-oxononanoate aminotransferase